MKYIKTYLIIFMIFAFGITAKADMTDANIDNIQHIRIWESGSYRANDIDTYNKNEMQYILFLLNSISAEVSGHSYPETEIDRYEVEIYNNDDSRETIAMRM